MHSQQGDAEKAAFIDYCRTNAARVEAELRRALDRHAEDCGKYGPAVSAPVRLVADLCLRGGKRLRPALVALGYEAFGGTGGAERVVAAGVAFELLQAFLLIHDDFMDGDRLRRGGPAAHVALERTFGSAAGGAAIVAGDYAAALAQEQLLRLDLPAERLLATLRLFARMQLEVAHGQWRDLARADRSLEGLETTYALKTASYTLYGPLATGCLLAGKAEGFCQRLEDYTRPLGVAFQLRDDLLNSGGDSGETGKSTGTDASTGRVTALSVARGAGMDEREASAWVERRIQTLLSQARASVEGWDVREEARSLFAGAILCLGMRSR
ncbi:MAG TPA: polyprenyl synthetase family protein [Myxococcaceae bacterium]|nr:polyprenyl synthetase family protein [Myxococcaceae bacterium]